MLLIEAIHECSCVGTVNTSGVVPDGALGSRNVEMPKHYEICGKVTFTVTYPPKALDTADQQLLRPQILIRASIKNSTGLK